MVRESGVNIHTLALWSGGAAFAELPETVINSRWNPHRLAKADTNELQIIR